MPVERIEIDEAKIFYNYFSVGSKSQLEVSREIYQDDHSSQIFYFAGDSVSTPLTVEEVEDIIKGLQNMVDQVKM